MIVEIYGKDNCPQCTKAEFLLQSTQLEISKLLLGKDFSREELLEKFPTARTFPQITIDGIHIGGCDELEKYLDQ